MTTAANEIWIKSLRRPQKSLLNNGKLPTRRSRSEVPNLYTLANQSVDKKLADVVCNSDVKGSSLQDLSKYCRRSSLLKESIPFDFSRHYRSSSDVFRPTIRSRSQSPSKFHSDFHAITENPEKRVSQDHNGPFDAGTGMWTKLRTSIGEMELSLTNLSSIHAVHRYHDDDDELQYGNHFQTCSARTHMHDCHEHDNHMKYRLTVGRYQRRTSRDRIQEDRDEARRILKAADDWRRAQQAIKQRQKSELLRFCQSLMETETEDKNRLRQI